jgi:hypothetical protein
MEAAWNPEEEEATAMASMRLVAEEEEATAMASMRLVACRRGRRCGSRLHRLSGSAWA